jgi:RNA polymerase primary sigma factor
MAKKTLENHTARRAVTMTPRTKATRAARIVKRRNTATDERERMPADESREESVSDETEVESEKETDLETVAGQPGEEEQLHVEEPSNFLAMYFRDMARLAVLQPNEEFESARHLEQLEVTLWGQVLSFLPLTDVVLKICERSLENSIADFKVLRRQADKVRKKGTKATAREREGLAKIVLRTSEQLRALDTDQRVMDIVLGELRKIYRGQPGRIINEKLDFNPKARGFELYLREVAAAYNRAHAAKNEFVKANLRLVVSIARRFNYGRMPLADLIQEGNIGLIKAVERYDYRRGYRFSTYASWWIRHAISRALADKGRAVRLPVHMIDAHHRLAKARRELSGRLGRPPTVDELAGKTGIPADKIEKMRTFLLDQSVSLDRPVNDEDGRKLVDLIQDPNAGETTPADDLADAAMTEEVRAQLMNLKPIEADILRQRFGLDTDQELTLKEIGEKYNLSRERIRQLQEQALAKMRRALQRKDMM